MYAVRKERRQEKRRRERGRGRVGGWSVNCQRSYKYTPSQALAQVFSRQYMKQLRAGALKMDLAT